ncbi:MAG: protease modulator HflC [Oligoflexus sp.]
MSRIQIGILATAALLLILIRGTFFTVQEWQQAIIVQFGRIVGEPKVDAGLHFKLPFVQEVRYFDKRMITWDGEPSQVPTRDKKFIFVDTTARWRISDPVLFLQTVQSEAQAMRRITSIIDGKIKTIVSNHNLVETVRNTNNIIEKVRQAEENLDGDTDVDERITGDIEKVEFGRERLSQMIAEDAQLEVQSLGIELIDVLIRRIAYETSVEAKVFERMISERTRIAEKIRSIGKGEEAKIRGQMNLELRSIESEAYREAQTLQGRAEAEAIEIFAKAASQDAKFFEFNRTLDAYKKSLPNRAQLILGTESEFFRLLKQGN